MRSMLPWLLSSLVTAALLPSAATLGDVVDGIPGDATTTPEEPSAATHPETPVETWSFSISAATYVVPDSSDYVQPTVTADADWLHLEARYNYEGLDSGSLWLGLNFGIGDRLTLAFTPMVGAVFGDVTGVAPGCKLTLGFWKLELYTEAEYLFDTDDHSGNFGYAWSELALAPLEWIRFGGVSQRTRAYETDVDIQRGLLLGLAYRWLSFTTYVFNLDQSQQTVVLSVGAEF